MLFGAAFLLAFAGGLAGLYSLRPEWVTVAGLKERMFRLKAGLWSMAAIAWATVVVGSFIAYPWYRAKPPEGATGLSTYPRFLLLANPNTAAWHKFGMEWKEHVGWLAPIAVAYYGPALAKKAGERRTLMLFYLIAFGTAAIAGVFGAFINKVAPLR
jgi:hypothetical protein